MTSDRDTRRIVRSWLDDGVTALPDRILDEVLDRVPATRQRRGPMWRLRNIRHSNHAVAIGVVAAAVVLIAYLGFAAVGSTNVGDGPPAPVPSAIPSNSVHALPIGLVRLQAGTYSIDRAFPVRLTLDIPDGWSSCTDVPREPGLCGVAGAELSFMRIENIVADPCDASRAPLEPPVGPSVADLVAALVSLDGFTSSEPVDVTIDGFRGTRFKLIAPLQPNCNFGDAGLGTWSSATWTNGVSPAETNHILILDLDGERVMVAGAWQPMTPPIVQDELIDMMDSIRLDR